MNLLKNLKVASRLGLGFGLLLMLLLAVATLGITRMAQIEARLETMANVSNVETQHVVKMRIATNQVAAAVRDLIIATDEGEMKTIRESLDKSRANYDAAEEKLGQMLAARAGTTAKEKDLFAKVKDYKTKASVINNRVIELGMANKNDEASQLFLREGKPAQAPWFSTLGELADLEASLNEALTLESAKAYDSARTLMLVLAGAAIVLGAGAGWLIARSITAELGGEPDCASEVARQISAGNLSVDVQVRSGDDKSLLAALRDMRDNLARVVGQVRQSSESIATGSAQIATGNADLSQRTEEQASNLQQTAASMEELTSTVKQNSDTARQANQLATSASAAATQGGVVVGQVVSTMEAIAASSRKISDIIGVIDGIAFQTNILALNAAVEAARAGEQGRGFAVVASEVRSLAQRSANAAKQIKSLISESVEKVETGSKLVGDAGKSMQDIVSQVKRVNDLIAEISAASVEQTQGIGQVGDAVNQLDQVTQQNAALVEESAAAADSLSQQAAKLAELVSVFKLAADDRYGAPRAAARPSGAERRGPNQPSHGAPLRFAAQEIPAQPPAKSSPATKSALTHAGTDHWVSF